MGAVVSDEGCLGREPRPWDARWDALRQALQEDPSVGRSKADPGPAPGPVLLGRGDGDATSGKLGKKAKRQPAIPVVEGSGGFNCTSGAAHAGSLSRRPESG
mmetsp:Transcript_44719/g.90248  ORF Transcript_44719/g.90248 Transcript_44719/m.90248 type:complete len:102 (-) Transcript_44719:118-423(-)